MMKGMIRIGTGLLVVATCTACGRVEADIPEADAGATGTQIDADVAAAGHVEGRVTDQQGRFALPELPEAEYEVWTRGYGLVDSEPVTAAPGAELMLEARPAPDARAAAQIYPADHWLSLLEPPE